MSQQLTDEQRKQLADQVKRFCRDQKIPQERLAKMAGYSGTTISEVLNGKYGADAGPVLIKLEAVMHDHGQRWGEHRKFVETKVASHILTMARTAKKSGRICMVYGNSGIGKSMTLRAVCRAHPTSLLLEVNDKSNTPTHLYSELVRLVLGTGGHSSMARNFRTLSEELTGSDRLLIFDEAENLKPAALNAIRQIHDETGCPVLLCGRELLLTNIEATRTDPRMGGGLVGRIFAKRCVGGRSKGAGGRGPVQPLFSEDEILQMIARSEVRIAKDAGRWLCAVANLVTLGDGREGCGLRYALSLFDLTVKCNEDEDVITLSMLKEVNAELLDEDYVATIEVEITEFARQLKMA